MHKKLEDINLKQIQDLKRLISKVKKIKYNKLYLFPFNATSKFLSDQLDKKNHSVIDNYNKSKICIPLKKAMFNKDDLIIITDKKLYKELNLNIKYKKIFFNYKKNIKKINLDTKRNDNFNLSKLFEFYNSDKAKYQKRLNHNYKTHNYGPFYDAQFKKMKHKKLNILEIGSFKGSSAAAFMHYFKNSNLYCVDVDHKNFMFKSNRIKLFKLDYMNSKNVKRFCRIYKNFFDIIIDDGGHYKTHILNNLKYFFNCLKNKDSFYVIEDYGLKFNYLNDSKTEPSIFNVIKNLNNKKKFISKILDKKDQNYLITKINKIYEYQGKWIKYKQNISDVCFIKN
jgi:hypothetical protein